MISSLKLVVIFLTFLKSQSRAHNVVFELLDSEFNEVIFVGEKDIMLNCSVTCGKNAVITIKRGQSEVARSTINDGYLVYNIDEVLQGDNGEYTCTVSYFNVNTGLNVTETETLHLNLKEVRPQCFRNGTEGEAFQVGDSLLLSCYCLEDDDCKWISGIEGSGTAGALGPAFKTILYRGKIIQRQLENYTTSTNTNIRYDCIMGQNFCSIGPEVKSAEDTIINNVSSSNNVSRDQSACDIFQTSTTLSMIKSTAGTVPKQNDVIHTTASDTGERNIFPIVLIAGGIVIFILLILVVVCIVLKFGKANKTESNKHTNCEGQMYTNAAFNRHNGIQDDLDSKNDNTETQMSSDYDLPPMGKNNRDNPSMQENYADVKKSGNGHVLYDFPPESQDDYSYRERNGPSSNEAVSSIGLSQNGHAAATGGHESSSHGNDSDRGYLYSQIDKTSGTSREQHGKNPDFENVEDDEDFAKLYAKVDKDRRNHPKNATEMKTEQNNRNGDFYAEIDQR